MVGLPEGLPAPTLPLASLTLSAPSSPGALRSSRWYVTTPRPPDHPGHRDSEGGIRRTGAPERTA